MVTLLGHLLDRIKINIKNVTQIYLFSPKYFNTFLHFDILKNNTNKNKNK